MSPRPAGMGGGQIFRSADFGSGVVQSIDEDTGVVTRQVVFDDPKKKGESSRRVSINRTTLNETIVTDTYSWSVTKEDWETVATDSSDFGIVNFSFKVRARPTAARSAK